jgi:hypothetical protein
VGESAPENIKNWMYKIGTLGILVLCCGQCFRPEEVVLVKVHDFVTIKVLARIKSSGK